MLYDISYENLILYGATIPSYDSDSKDNKHTNPTTTNNNEVIRADDPANWSRMRSLFKNSK